MRTGSSRSSSRPARGAGLASRHPGLWIALGFFVVSLIVLILSPDGGRTHVISRSAALVSSSAFVAELLIIRIIARYGDDDHDDAV